MPVHVGGTLQNLAEIYELTGVNDTAISMHVIKSEQDLFGNLPDKMLRHPFPLMPFDEAQKVFTQNLKDHTNVYAIRPPVTKMIKKGDDM